VKPVSHDHAVQVAALAAEFAWLIDHRSGIGVSALFTANGLYGYTGFEMRGRQAIDAFYRERAARGKRLSRHIFSPARLALEEDNAIAAWSTLTLYAADGETPHAATPVAVMDYADRIVAADGALKFERRWVTLLFGQMPHLVKAQNLEGEPR
jgi:uncharacterized protein YyaL (SSP411 family)